jgi:hypothetical protein
MKPLSLAGASFALMLTLAALAMPAAKPATASFASDDSRVVLHLSARDAGVPPPVIAGDFTNWMPVRMERHKDEWRYSVHASPGVYHFAFQGADGHWFVPTGFPNRTNDGMGGWVAVLVIL